MKVTAQNHDDVSALLTVTLEKSDYKEKVEKQLVNYAKNAQVPGFRKGKVPLSMVKKKYEAGITFEEINKQVSEALKNYISDNKLRLVGQPIPQLVNELDYYADQLEVSFEIGFEPEFTIDLAKYEVPYYKVEASDKEISKSIENMQTHFAEKVHQDKITKDSYITVEVYQIVEEDVKGEYPHPKNIIITAANKEVFKLLHGLKIGESVKVTKETLEENQKLAKELEVSKEDMEHLYYNNEVEVKVKDIYLLNLAELNQDLFNKVYGEGNVNSKVELKNKIKEELDEYFQHDADIHFVNKVLEQVIEKEEVKLPEEFLVKWFLFSNQNIQSEEQAKQIFEVEKSKLKYQVIKNKLMTDNAINIDYSDILAQAGQLLKKQLFIHGIHRLGDKEIQKYVVEILKDKEQVRQISSEVVMAKLKDIILEKAIKKETKISHDKFLEEIKK